MAEIRIAYTLTTPGPDITFNSGTDVYRLTNVTGLDHPSIRGQVDDAPQTDGGLVHNRYFGPRHITMEGYLRIRSTTDSEAVIGVRNGMEDNLLAALSSILRADGTLSFTRTGGSARSLTVRYDMPCIFTGEEGQIKKFMFGLVAANPFFA